MNLSSWDKVSQSSKLIFWQYPVQSRIVHNTFVEEDRPVLSHHYSAQLSKFSIQFYLYSAKS